MSSSRLKVSFYCTGIFVLLFSILVNFLVVQRPGALPLLHMALICVLGVSLSIGCNQILIYLKLLSPAIKLTDLLLTSTPGLCLSLTWGRQIFLSFFYHDELGYFSVVNQNWPQTAKWLLEPLNEHFQPLLKLVLVPVCNIWGVSNYFGIAIVTFVAAILLCRLLHLVIEQITGSQEIALVTACAFASAFDFADVYQYKAAGFPLIVSLAFLLFGILEVLPRGNGLPSPYKLGIYTAISVFFSSLATVPFFYLIPFILLRYKEINGTGGRARFWALGGAVATPSIVYFFLRWLLGVPSPRFLQKPDLIAIVKMVGSYATHDFFISSNYLTTAGILVLVGAAIAVYRLLYTLARHYKSLGTPAQPDFRPALLFFGLTVLLLVPLQLYFGRGFQLAGNGFQRYEIFPVMGTLLVLAAGLALASGLSANRVLGGHPYITIAASFLITILAGFSHFEMDRRSPWPIKFCIEVNTRRSEFFSSLEAALEESRYSNLSQLGYGRQNEYIALPDFWMEDSFLYLHDGYPVSHYAHALASGAFDILLVPFTPANGRPEAAILNGSTRPAALNFYRRYFPKQSATLNASP